MKNIIIYAIAFLVPIAILLYGVNYEDTQVMYSGIAVLVVFFIAMLGSMFKGLRERDQQG